MREKIEQLLKEKLAMREELVRTLEAKLDRLKRSRFNSEYGILTIEINLLQKLLKD